MSPLKRLLINYIINNLINTLGRGRSGFKGHDEDYLLIQSGSVALVLTGFSEGFVQHAPEIWYLGVSNSNIFSCLLSELKLKKTCLLLNLSKPHLYVVWNPIKNWISVFLEVISQSRQSAVLSTAVSVHSYKLPHSFHYVMNCDWVHISMYCMFKYRLCVCCLMCLCSLCHALLRLLTLYWRLHHN